jgi:tetratricopeptide (TPR) repeat protein
MKNKLLLVIGLMVCTVCHAQKKMTAILEKLYANQQYDEIIENHTDKVKKYPAKALYYVGMAYYMKADDANCLKYMDMSIAKDDSDADAYYIKGMTQNYMEQYDAAIHNLNQAIALYDDKAEYYAALGDAHKGLEQKEKALEAYQISLTKDNTPDRAYYRMPPLYLDLGKKEEAIKAYYLAAANINKETDDYVRMLYNIGLFELLDKKFEKAEKAFAELLEIVPNDYGAYSKMIQIYYGLKNYDKAEIWRQKLYKAYRKNLLGESQKEMFCFDQFQWKNKLIQVFERYAEPEGELYYKHLFYVVNEKNEIDFRIQTENSVIAQEMGSGKYVLGKSEGSTHSTYPIIFQEDFEYENLKQTVIRILEDEVSPASSSRPSGNSQK